MRILAAAGHRLADLAHAVALTVALTVAFIATAAAATGYGLAVVAVLLAHT